MPKKRSANMRNLSQQTPEKWEQKQEEIGSNLVLYGLLLTLLLATLTYWHFSNRYLIPLQQKQQKAWQESTKTEDSLSEFNQEIWEQADLNQDGKIDASDANLLKERFYQTDSESLKADLNQDAKVDSLDYSLLLEMIRRGNTSEF